MPNNDKPIPAIEPEEPEIAILEAVPLPDDPSLIQEAIHRRDSLVKANNNKRAAQQFEESLKKVNLTP
jgi:hypothetical protein